MPIEESLNKPQEATGILYKEAYAKSLRRGAAERNMSPSSNERVQHETIIFKNAPLYKIGTAESIMSFLEAASEMITTEAHPEEHDDSESPPDRALGEDDDFRQVTSAGRRRTRIGGARRHKIDDTGPRQFEGRIQCR